MTPQCLDYQAAYLDSDADATDHVDSCLECQRELDALDEMRGFLMDPAAWAAPQPSLERRVTRTVRGPGRDFA